MEDSKNIIGVSYVGRPKSNTAVFLVKKVEYLLDCLYNAEGCLVFIEEGIVIPEDLSGRHKFVVSKTPQAEYSRFVIELYKEVQSIDRKRKYVLTDGGYYLGENTSIGDDSYIAPGCLIGHDVAIGNGAVIEAHATIKNAVIGNNFVLREGAVIGGEGFTMTVDENNDWIRTPSFGNIIVGNDVEIGINSCVARGTADSTYIGNNVKMDALVYIGHDARIEDNTVISAGGIVGGYVEAKERTKIGFNATVRNRLVLGEHSVIGMGATVVSEVSELETVVGNPARVFIK